MRREGATIIKHEGWEKVKLHERRVDIDRMLIGVEVMPSQEDVLDGFSMLPATSA